MLLVAEVKPELLELGADGDQHPVEELEVHPFTQPHLLQDEAAHVVERGVHEVFEKHADIVAPLEKERADPQLRGPFKIVEGGAISL